MNNSKQRVYAYSTRWTFYDYAFAGVCIGLFAGWLLFMFKLFVGAL